MKKSVNIDIEFSVEEIAQIIWELNATEQAELINRLMCVDLLSKVLIQIDAVAEECGLNARRFFKEFSDRLEMMKNEID